MTGESSDSYFHLVRAERLLHRGTGYQTEWIDWIYDPIDWDNSLHDDLDAQVQSATVLWCFVLKYFEEKRGLTGVFHNPRKDLCNAMEKHMHFGFFQTYYNDDNPLNMVVYLNLNVEWLLRGDVSYGTDWEAL